MSLIVAGPCAPPGRAPGARAAAPLLNALSLPSPSYVSSAASTLFVMSKFIVLATEVTLSFLYYGALMPKAAPFSMRLSRATDELVAGEARRTRRSKGAIVESLAEEALRTRRFPGLAFRGSDWDRRPWVIGTALDVWEIVAASRSYDSPEEMAANTELTEAQIRLALAYHHDFPDEIDTAIAENDRPLGDLRREYPTIDTLTGELAAEERRILVTFNVKDFARLSSEWAAAGTRHAGCLMIVGIDHAEFGLTLRVINAALAARPDQKSWIDYAAWGTPPHTAGRAASRWA
jgi:uncharacterized protein (DUF433 family)